MEFFNDVGGDPLKPTLFELVAQEQLRDLLQPALKYVLSVSSALSLPNSFVCLMVMGVVGIRTEVPSTLVTSSKST